MRNETILIEALRDMTDVIYMTKLISLGQKNKSLRLAFASWGHLKGAPDLIEAAHH